MTVPEWIGYEEQIDSFSFREKCSIKIPKAVRERAFSLQLDIEIMSTDGNDYANYKSIPAYGFFGYVVLVMRDYSEIQIPIVQPRQVLFYERIEEAYVNWYALYLKAVDSFEKAFISEFQLTPIAEQLGLTAVSPSPTCPAWSGFEETRLREVYVKCRFGTRFNLEISHWAPLEVTYGECTYDGRSKQEDDPKKDEGLPPDGVQPTNNGDRNNPYSGYPSASEEQDLGEWSNNSKLSNVDKTNPDNEPENNLKRWAFVRGQYKDFAQGCTTLYFGLTFEISSEDDSLTPYVQPPYPVSDACGGQLVLAELRGDNTGTVYGVFGGDGTYVTNIVDAFENPFQGYSPTSTPPS